MKAVHFIIFTFFIYSIGIAQASKFKKPHFKDFEINISKQQDPIILDKNIEIIFVLSENEHWYVLKK